MNKFKWVAIGFVLVAVFLLLVIGGAGMDSRLDSIVPTKAEGTPTVYQCVEWFPVDGQVVVYETDRYTISSGPWLKVFTTTGETVILSGTIRVTDGRCRP